MIAVEGHPLETRGHGRVNNNRAVQSARRQAVAALAHTAAGIGIALVAVPTRGSSALCSGCDEPIARPGGYHHAGCPRCRVGGNRENVAGVNLATRALLGRSKVTRRHGELYAVWVAEHAPVRKPRQGRHDTAISTGPPWSAHRDKRMGSESETACSYANPVVWDTVNPTPPHGDAGSRDTRTSPTPPLQWQIV
ncbi:transposase (plasmid) [Rhodococcus opacus]|uniref:Transposase n=1 Tax=Rhodococcus opacus TaxID=37919 RepID=A0A1B1KHP1_RHOOP|nr:transposase [Rhodococcus opacus]